MHVALAGRMQDCFTPGGIPPDYLTPLGWHSCVPGQHTLKRPASDSLACFAPTLLQARHAQQQHKQAQHHTELPSSFHSIHTTTAASATANAELKSLDTGAQ